MDEMGAKKKVLPMKVNIVGVQEDKKDNKVVKVARHWEQKQVGESARWSTTCERKKCEQEIFSPSPDVAHALALVLLRVLAVDAACVCGSVLNLILHSTREFKTRQY